MPHLDRDSFIALLDRLGDPDEAEVLATAREIDRRVRESGMTWSELLAPPPSAARGSGESYDEYRGAFTDDDLFDVDHLLDENGQTLVFAEMKDPVRRKIERYELTRTIDPRHFFPTIEAAVDAYRQEFGERWSRDEEGSR